MTESFLTVSLAQAEIFFLALTRVLMITAQVPMFGGTMIPGQFKIALGVLLTMILIPWQPLPATAEGLPLLVFVAALFQELVVGFLAGFAVVLTFGAFQIAGRIIDLSSGFAAAQVFNPTLGESQTPLDMFFLEVVYLFFLVIDGHHGFILGIQKTFEVLPVLSPLPPFSATQLITLTSELIKIGFQIAMPLFGALLMTDLSLGFLSRIAPQIQVFFLGLPLKILVGLGGMMIILGILTPVFRQMFFDLGGRMLRLIGA